jgi:hypothetical protein
MSLSILAYNIKRVINVVGLKELTLALRQIPDPIQ